MGLPAFFPNIIAFNHCFFGPKSGFGSPVIQETLITGPCGEETSCDNVAPSLAGRGAQVAHVQRHASPAVPSAMQ